MAGVDRLLRAAAAAGAALSVAGTCLALVNSRHLRRPSAPSEPITETVSVLIPTRNEAPRVAACLDSALTQTLLADHEVIVLDDGSADGTPEIARAVLAGRPGVDARVVECPDTPPPDGWLGKPWASTRLADAARGDVLVFLDADVVLEPTAVASAVWLLRSMGVDVLSPYPRQLADGVVPRLVQPLLQWSWMTTVPLRVSESTRRESLSVANGQFLVADAAAYRRAGGFGSVRGRVLDDVALLRAVKRSGGTGTVVDGSTVATCRMYDSSSDLVAGYTKSLWSAFGGPAGSAAVVSLMLTAYVVPPIALLAGPSATTRALGAIGYLAAVAGRITVARSTGQPVWPEALVHPASIAVFAALNVESWRRLRRGELTWKGRTVVSEEGS